MGNKGMKLMRILAVGMALLVLGQSPIAGEDAVDAGPTLYDRMGGWYRRSEQV